MTDLLILFNDEIKIFGIKLINSADFFELVVRFFFNLAIILTIIRFLYYPFSRRKDYYFAFLLVGIVVFLITYSLVSAEKQFGIGVGIGLFALFGILRFRTSQIAIKEMTYLLVIIGVSVINSLVTTKTSYAELLFINLVIIFAIWTGERIWVTMNENRKTIVYEKIDLIKPEKRKELIEDLRQRTGLDVTRVQIGRINFMRDTARIRIFYRPSSISGMTDEDDNSLIDNDNI
jgi:hypothetical protein